MRFGAVLPHNEIGSDPVAIRAYLEGLETLGASHLLAYDHVLGADRDREGGFSGPYDKDVAFHEPLTFFAYAAAVTSRLEFMSAVLILPQRQTALVAKQAAEVAILSGNRLRLGIGTGWNKVEYDALNENFRNRGKREADQVQLMRRLRRIGGAWFCELGVDYCFTRDGKNESSFADSLLAGIKRLDHHPAVRSWTTMWETWLQGDLLTADSLLAFGSLLTFPVDRGIDEAWWGPAPATSVDDDTTDAAPDADADAVLRLAGIAQADLLSLLDDEAAAPPSVSATPPPRPRRRAPAKSPRPGRRSTDRSSA